MTLAKDEGLARVEETIAENLGPYEDGSILTGYVLLTEWASADGEVYLVESRPEGQPYWRSLGLLEAARLSIDHGTQAREIADEEDGDG